MTSELLDEARQLLDAGQPREALARAERALQTSRASGSPAAQRRAAHLVAEALFVTGDIARARVLAGEALRVSQAGDDPGALGEDLNLLGAIDIVEERPDEAVFLLRRSYDLRARAGGADSPGAVESLRNLAFAIGRAGGTGEALELLEDALRRCERSLGEGFEQGRYDDAREAFEQALALRVRELGHDRQETLDTAAAHVRTLETLDATSEVGA